MEENRQFSGMYRAAVERLETRRPEQIAVLSGAEWDGEAFRLNSLGQEFVISYPDYRFQPGTEPWRALTILHYLAMADGAPLTGVPMTFGQYPNGMVRGGGFDREVETAIRQTLGNLSPEVLMKLCRQLGGKMVSSNADLCVAFSFLPRYPVWLKIWFGDEEFPASGRMLLDRSAGHYLTIEDAVTVGGLILGRLLEKIQGE